jgi:hypothetical protein
MKRGQIGQWQIESIAFAALIGVVIGLAWRRPTAPTASAPAAQPDASGVEEPPAAYSHRAVLDPLTADVLVRRTSDTFPSGYLTLIAIIQGVALGIWLTSALPLILGSPDALHRIAVLGECVAGLSTILIVSYQYLWFSTVMRWTPTFLDTLVPYALGVAEIIPAILIVSSFRWWTSVTVFMLVATGALVHTIYRSAENMFPGMSLVYYRIRRLLARLSWCCVLIMVLSALTAILIAATSAPVWLIAVMPWVITAIGLVMVVLTERCLATVYADYGVFRR